MDENERTELEQQMDEVSGHLSSTNEVKSRRGRGFTWNAKTGKYTGL